MKRNSINGTQVSIFKLNATKPVTPIGCPFWKIERPKAYWPIDWLRLAAGGRGGADDLMALRHSHCLRKTAYLYIYKYLL